MGQALSKYHKLLVGIFLRITLQVTTAVTIMVGKIMDSDRVLQMTAIMPSSSQAISPSRLTKEFSKLWITSETHILIMEINSKLLKARFLKSKEAILSNRQHKLPLSSSNSNTLNYKSLLDSSPNNNPNSLNKFNNRPNSNLRWTL